MCVENCGQQTPATIDLRIVLVDLGNNEKNLRRHQAECKCRYHRIGRNIEILDVPKTTRCEQVLWEIVQLSNERNNRLLPIGAFLKTFDDWKCHTGKRCDGHRD